MEIDGKDLNKVWNGFLILLIIVLGFQYMNRSGDFYDGVLATRKKKSYQGIVSRKFIDYENHAIRTIVINRAHITVNTEFYKRIDIGDSLSKKKGDYIVWLYKKNGKILFFDHEEHIENVRHLKNQQRSK